MKPSCQESGLNVEDWRVRIVLLVLCIPRDRAADALARLPNRRDYRGRCFVGCSLCRYHLAVLLRRRIILGLRELRVGGCQLSGPEIAQLVGAPNHSTVFTSIAAARRLGLLTESEISALRQGGVPRVRAGGEA